MGIKVVGYDIFSTCVRSVVGLAVLVTFYSMAHNDWQRFNQIAEASFDLENKSLDV
jgi:hypothetical protein